MEINGKKYLKKIPAGNIPFGQFPAGMFNQYSVIN
jgi:hypothetical protein